jgi:hypothetical protein
MKVFANGFPKSGNHALVKTLQLLGIPAQVNHVPYSADIDARCVLIVRDPRNVVISWLRALPQPVTPGMMLSSFRRFEKASLAEEMAAFEPWLQHGIVVRYEELIASDAAMRKLADELGVPYLDDAWRWLPGMTATWNQTRSDFREVWLPEVAAAWEAEGGRDLVERWGYEWNC